MHEKQYLILLDIDARKRHYHVTDNGKIIKFVVQLEVKTRGFWKVVLRYDTFHGYAHKDCIVIYPALKVFTGKGFAWCFNRCYRGGQKSEVRN